MVTWPGVQCTLYSWQSQEEDEETRCQTPQERDGIGHVYSLSLAQYNY